MDATFEFVEGADEYIAPAVDVTDLLGTDELIDHQNQHVTFTDLTVEAAGQDVYKRQRRCCLPICLTRR